MTCVGWLRGCPMLAGAYALMAVGCSSPAHPGTSLPSAVAPDSGATQGGGNADASMTTPAHDAGVGDATANGDASSDAPANGVGADASTQDAATEAGGEPPRCDPAHTWTNVQSVPLVPAAPADFARLGGIATDELTIAWTSTTNLIEVADRASSAVAFDQATVLDSGATALAMDRVALAPNGMTLIAVVGDRSTFAGFNRAGAGAPWIALPASQFANVAAMIAEGGGEFSEPVLGADDLSFFFLVTPTASAPLLVESTWDAQNHAWGTGIGFANVELASTDATHRRRPTAASSDGLTLFFYDETNVTERAAWRTSPAGPLEQFVDLPSLAEAAPDGLCDKLYFAGPVDAGGPVEVAQ